MMIFIKIQGSLGRPDALIKGNCATLIDQGQAGATTTCWPAATCRRRRSSRRSPDMDNRWPDYLVLFLT